MHSIRTTPGLVTTSRPYGESGKIISIFTRDFGLIKVSAPGIRAESSKLRYFAQDYSFGTFSVVKGREYWKLTSAGESPSGMSGPRACSDKGGEVVARSAMILNRLLHGEESVPSLYAYLAEMALFLKTVPSDALDDARTKTLEAVVIARILADLGYLDKKTLLVPDQGESPFDLGLLDRLSERREGIYRAINAALRESHLW